MLVSKVLNLAFILFQQGLEAYMQGKDTIEVEALGDEHRAELAELLAYRDTLPDAQDESV